ncbi:hypothetical protein GALL_489960 [mine drainage metagenome]|uniref:Uncharacterized protein n=1 Tax=mine drainage metagenome TaxID=410659 RepID=A0A1J5PP98_9ZZZZ
MHHELAGLLEHVLGVDQDFADVAGEIVADGADDQRRFLIDQERSLLRFGRVAHCAPQLEQVVQVPLQLFDLASDARSAGDQAHALGVLELVHRLAQFLAVFAFDAPAHAAAARIVGHEHQIASGQRDIGGERGALVAALFLFHLHQQLLAFLDGVLDARLRGRYAFAEILARNFLERQEAVALLAVIDEAGFERGFDAGDDGFVDIALALLAPGLLDIAVEEFLPLDDGHAQFFRLRGIEQHAFHFNGS